MHQGLQYLAEMFRCRPKVEKSNHQAPTPDLNPLDEDSHLIQGHAVQSTIKQSVRVADTSKEIIVVSIAQILHEISPGWCVGMTNLETPFLTPESTPTVSSEDDMNHVQMKQ